MFDDEYKQEKGYDMEKILRQYEQTIDKIEVRIEQLKIEKRRERSLERLHKLEDRIELLKTERLEMIQVCRQIREYLMPKEDIPSPQYKNVSGDI